MAVRDGLQPLPHKFWFVISWINVPHRSLRLMTAPPTTATPVADLTVLTCCWAWPPNPWSSNQTSCCSATLHGRLLSRVVTDLEGCCLHCEGLRRMFLGCDGSCGAHTTSQMNNCITFIILQIRKYALGEHFLCLGFSVGVAKS